MLKYERFFMPRKVSFLLFIVAFIAGCAHTKPLFYYQAEGQAQPQPRTQYCPAAVFEGATPRENPDCVSSSQMLPPVRYDDHYALTIYAAIRSQKEALSKCYAATSNSGEASLNGMFLADIAIDSFGKAGKITFIKASVNPDIPVMDAPQDMLACINVVLAGITYPIQETQHMVVRAYFLGYHTPGDAAGPQPPKQSAFLNDWNLRDLQTDNPFKQPEKFFRLPSPRARYCPVAVFEGNSQVTTPACGDGSPDDLSLADDSDTDIGLRTYEIIRLQRNALFACYKASTEKKYTNGMLIADIVISGSGKAEKISYYNASITPHIPVLNASQDMLSCFNDVLAGIPYTGHDDQRYLVRTYFLCYQDPENTPYATPSTQARIINNWNLDSVESIKLYDQTAKYEPVNRQPTWNSIQAYLDRDIFADFIRRGLFQKTSLPGKLDRYIVAKVIQRKLSGIRFCYQKELNKNPNLQGKIVIRFTVGGTGHVARASVLETTMHNVYVEECMARIIKSTIFPKPKGGGSVVVSYPFVCNPI